MNEDTVAMPAAATAETDAARPPLLHRLLTGMLSGRMMIRDRLVLFSLLGLAIVVSLLAVIFVGQLRSLSLHGQAVQGLYVGQRLDRLVYTLAREREGALVAPASMPATERRNAAVRRSVDEAHAELSTLLVSTAQIHAAIGSDTSLSQLPLYVKRLRQRVDQQVMSERTAEALYSEAIRQMLRVAGRLEECCIAPGLGSRTTSLLIVAMLVDEFSRQSALLRRLEQASGGGLMPQDRALFNPLVDSRMRSDHMLEMLAAHSDPAVAMQARAIQVTASHRSIEDFTNNVSLGAWSASYVPRWQSLLEDADRLIDLTQETRQRLALGFIDIAERQASATRRNMLWATVLGLALIAVMGITLGVMYVSIARPLDLLAHAAEAAVAGKLHASVGYRAPDEVGHLGRALQVLINTIAHFRSEMVRAREAVSRGDLSVRADGSGFRGEWRSLIDRFNDTLAEFGEVHRLFQRQAFHHPDSGLPNRLGLAHTLSAHPPDTACSVFLLRLVRLEDISATLGADFAAGMVATLSRQLVARFGERYVIAQISSREFAFVRLDTQGADLPLPGAAAAEIVRCCDEPLAHGEALASTPGRVGVASGRLGDLHRLITHATIASHRAAQHARPGYEVHDETHRLQREKARHIELALPLAIQQGEVFMVYQPVVDASRGEIVAFEALMRWRRADGQFIAPMDFIPIAEDTGHILALGEASLRIACSDFMQPAVRQAFGQARLSVNVSPRQLMETDFPATIRDVLEATGMPARLLGLEITESAFMDDPDVCIERINSLRAMGITIYLDDFGTGFSSMAYLARIAIDVLKIDQSFIRGRSEDPANQRIVSAIVNLAHSMGVVPLAEGVEGQAERNWLLSLGCVHHQGYLYARPAPFEQHVAAHPSVVPA